MLSKNMKICPKCGNVIQDDNERFCQKCGKDLWGNSNDGGICLGGSKPKKTISSHSQFNNKILIAIIGSALVIILILMIMFFRSRSSKTSVIIEEPYPTIEQNESENQPVPNNVVNSLDSHQDVNDSPDSTSGVSEQNVDAKNNESESVAKSQDSAKSSDKQSGSTSKSENKTDDLKQQKLSEALAKGNYRQVKELADEGYAPAYVPLAKHYLNNHEYDAADKYAQKAKNANQSGAKKIIEALENLGYYD